MSVVRIKDRLSVTKIYLYGKLVSPFLQEQSKKEDQSACAEESNVVHRITPNQSRI